jgi:hypothetical protein
MMLFLANTGSSTATMFKFFYMRISTIKRKLKNRRLNRLYGQQQRIDFDNDFGSEMLNEYDSSKNYLYDTYHGAANVSRTGSKKSMSPSPYLTHRQTSFKKKNQSSRFDRINESPSACAIIQTSLDGEQNNYIRFNDMNSKKASSGKKNAAKKKKAKKSNRKKSSKKEEKLISVEIGIRNVEVPHDLIDKAVLRTQIISTISDEYAKKIQNNKEKDKSRGIITTFDPLRLLDAIKRMDNLIRQDNNGALTSNPSSIIPKLEDSNSLKDDFESEMNHLDDDEDGRINSSYFISDMFKKGKTLKKKNEPPVEIEPKSEQILKINDKSDVILARKNSDASKLPLTAVSEKKASRLKSIAISLSLFNQIKKKHDETEIKKFYSKIESDPSTNRKPVNSPLSAGTESNENQIHLTHSTPGMDSKSTNSETNELANNNQANAHLKRNNFHRSTFSYDYYHNNQTRLANNKKNLSYTRLKSGRNNLGGGGGGLHQPMMYTPKQLHLIYSQYKQERQEKMGVPMLTTLIIIPCYLVCGMLIFSSFEQWRKLDALYFCFVTLSTIGFGDILPGSTFSNKNTNKNNLYISALYIFIGLILIAMCINLMKNQLKYKIKSITRKLGLSSTTDH